MKRMTLTLLRHAKSSWKNQDQTDHDRPLNGRGNRDAPEMAQRLVTRNQIPDLILCSTAQRTRETTAHLLRVFGEPAPQVLFNETLYLASPDTLLAALHDVPETTLHAMIVAHNPGMEDLSSLLSGGYGDTMPTAAIRQFSCACPLASLADLFATGSDSARSTTHSTALSAGDIQLIYSDYPKNLDS